MEALPQRQRSSTNASAMSTAANPSLVSELQALVNSLAEATANTVHPPTLEALQLQCEDLHRIRRLLVENAGTNQAKDAFRQSRGFTGLLKVFRPLAGIYNPRHLSRDERTQIFEVVKGSLEVLSEALNEHSGNRRYFGKRVEDGGWHALEEAIASIGVFGASVDHDTGVEEGQEQLFGLLLAFALGEESISPIFRGLASRAAEASAKNPDELAKHLRRYLTGKETLQNPDIIPAIVRFCKLMLQENNKSAKNHLPLAVLLALKHIASSSIRNRVAMHGTQVLSMILPLVFEELKPSECRRCLLDLADFLISCGINQLNDACYLFRQASLSDEAAEFVSRAMLTSRTPPFIQFDLSMHGYSSIELPTLGHSFPPGSSSNGYTFCAWFRVDDYDSDVHTTIFGSYDSTQTCFILAYLEKDSHHLILQTSVKQPKPSIRFSSVAFKPKTWYHIAVVHRRPKATTSSRANLFVNGVFMEQKKCQYPCNPPPQNSSTESFASLSSNTPKSSAIQAFLGTPQDLAVRLGRDVVSSKWSVGSFHLFQDALSDELIAVLSKLGPRYNGNFQDCLGGFQTYQASAELNRLNESLHPDQEENSDILAAVRKKASLLSPEHRLFLSFLPSAVLDNEDRNHINGTKLIKSLSKEAAKMMQHLIRSGGNSVIINCAIPSFNEAFIQPHGVGILTGDPVVIVPQALDDACWRIAGSAAVCLKLVELARTKDAVLRATEILFRSIEDSWRNSEAMERENGFGVLAGILHEKLGFGSVFEERAHGRPVPTSVDTAEREELALDLLRLILRFVGYDEVHPEESLIINPLAYRILLVDFDTWRRTPIATQKLYYSQFVHFAMKSRNQNFNTKRLIRMRKCGYDQPNCMLISPGIIKRFIDALKGETFNADVFPDFLEAFMTLFKCNCSGDNLRSLSLFITYALQDGRAFSYRSVRSKRPTLRDSNGHGSRAIDSERSTPRSLSPQPELLNNDLSQHEIGIQILDAFSDILCDPDNVEFVKRFAKTITNKVCDYIQINYMGSLMRS